MKQRNSSTELFSISTRPSESNHSIMWMVNPGVQNWSEIDSPKTPLKKNSRTPVYARTLHFRSSLACLWHHLREPNCFWNRCGQAKAKHEITILENPEVPKPNDIYIAKTPIRSRICALAYTREPSILEALLALWATI